MVNINTKFREVFENLPFNYQISFFLFFNKNITILMKFKESYLYSKRIVSWFGNRCFS